MERCLSDKIFVTKLNVRSTEELTLICSRSKRPADTGLEICRVGNVAQNNSASLMDVWTEHVRGKNCTNNKHLLKTMTLWLMCWLIQSHFETWHVGKLQMPLKCVYINNGWRKLVFQRAPFMIKLLICQRIWQNELESVWTSASAIASLILI